VSWRQASNNASATEYGKTRNNKPFFHLCKQRGSIPESSRAKCQMHRVRVGHVIQASGSPDRCTRPTRRRHVTPSYLRVRLYVIKHDTEVRLQGRCRNDATQTDVQTSLLYQARAILYRAAPLLGLHFSWCSPVCARHANSGHASRASVRHIGGCASSPFQIFGHSKVISNFTPFKSSPETGWTDDRASGFPACGQAWQQANNVWWQNLH
jgi:hypothetical protein